MAPVIQPGRYLAVLWSSAHHAVLRALADLHDGGMDVEIGTQEDNPADRRAVPITTDLPERAVGGQEATYDGGRRPVRIIGYVSRAEPRQAQLQAELAQAPAPQSARLVFEGADWWVVVDPPPAPLDLDAGDLPF